MAIQHLAVGLALSHAECPQTVRMGCLYNSELRLLQQALGLGGLLDRMA